MTFGGSAMIGVRRAFIAALVLLTSAVVLPVATPVGAAGGPAVSGDFTGDGSTDRVVWRAESGAWLVDSAAPTYLGLSTDVPVPGDYDGDGAVEPAVWRPETGTWFMQGQAPVYWGLPGDVPVPGDYDGDGAVEPAVWRPESGAWFIEGRSPVYWGLPSDVPVPGDYDGDGSTDVAVWRPETGAWFVEGQATVYWGLPGDVPVPGNYDGDGSTDVAVWRPEVGAWFVAGAETTFYGLAGDVPVPGDYDGDGRTDRAVWRPAFGGWFVHGLATAYWGLASDVPVVLPAAIARGVGGGQTLSTPALPTGTPRFLDAVARDLVGVAPDEVTLDTWGAQVAALGRTGFVTQELLGRPELREMVVDNLYVRALDRLATPEEHAAADAVIDGAGLEALAVEVFSSEEFFALADATPEGFVNTLAQRALDRDLFPEERDPLVATAGAEPGGRGAAATEVLGSVEAAQVRAKAWSLKLLSRDPEPDELTAWGQVVLDQGELGLIAFVTGGDAYDAVAQARFSEAELRTSVGTVVATVDQVVSASYGDEGDGLVVLAAGVAAPAVGHHLVVDGAHPSGGGIGRVIAVAAAGGGATEVHVVAASLGDAFVSGQVTDTTELVDPGSGEAQARSAPAEAEAGRSAPVPRAAGPQAASDGCSGELASRLRAEVGIDTRVDTHIDLKWSWRGLQGYDARFLLHVTPRAALTIQGATLSGSCSRQLWSTRFNAPVPVGPITIPGYVDISSRLDAEMNWEALVLNASVSVPCRIGVRSVNGSAENLTGCDRLTSSLTFTPVSAGTANLSANLQIGYSLGVDQGGWRQANVGLRAGPTIGVTGTASPLAAPNWAITAFLDIDVDFRANLFGKWTVNRNFGSWRPLERSLASGAMGQGTPSGTTRQPGTGSVHPNPPVPPPPTGVTTRVSVASDAAQANDFSFWHSISADGRYVAFESSASNLVPGDTNESEDVFVRDRLSGTTTRVSLDSGGVEANGSSHMPSISADGRYVAFSSSASNLVPGDTNEREDVFVRDRLSGTTTRVSVTSGGTQANGDSGWAVISGDGRYVAFASYASDLVAHDTNGRQDVFLHDRVAASTIRVSVGSDGLEGDRISTVPSISVDGRYVAFESASTLVSDDTNGYTDVFVYSRDTAAVSRVSVASDGAQANDGESSGASISSDGRYVAFSSFASNLVSDDVNGYSDVFVHDRSTGTTTRVSLASDGTQADVWSGGPSISADGRYVAFTSAASNLVLGDINDYSDVFVHDRLTGATISISLAMDGTPANHWSEHAVIAGDGRHVAFFSRASNLVLGDTNGAGEVFVHTRP